MRNFTFLGSKKFERTDVQTQRELLGRLSRRGRELRMPVYWGKRGGHTMWYLFMGERKVIGRAS